MNQTDEEVPVPESEPEVIKSEQEWKEELSPEQFARMFAHLHPESPPAK